MYFLNLILHLEHGILVFFKFNFGVSTCGQAIWLLLHHHVYSLPCILFSKNKGGVTLPYNPTKHK